MNRKKRRVSKGKIRRVGEILEEFLIGNFESEFSVGAALAGRREAEPVPPVEGSPGEPTEAVEPEREDVEDQQVEEETEAELYAETKYYFDLADVEYFVDVTITEIVQEKLVPGYDNPKKPPSLSEMFGVLFGEEDNLTKQVDEFQELISGYEDHVHIDDLQQAYDVMSEIVKELKDRSGN
jgi:hypothetical protein